MFNIKGQLINLLQVEEKVKAEYTTPAHNVLQILVENQDGKMDLMDVKDKEKVIKKEMIGKEINVSVKAFSPSDIYYSVA